MTNNIININRKHWDVTAFEWRCQSWHIQVCQQLKIKLSRPVKLPIN